MRRFLTIFLFTLLTTISGNISAQSVYRQERENQAMKRLAKDQANSSPASRIFWGGLAVAIIVFGIWSMVHSSNEKRKKQEARRQEIERQEAERKAKLDELRNEVQKAAAQDELIAASLDNVLSLIDNGNLEKAQLSFSVIKMKRIQWDILLDKYPQDKALKIFKGETWLGMTEDELTDAKGQPTKVEVEQLKTKTKRIFIYGNKSSGDVFTFENGTLSKLVDR